MVCTVEEREGVGVLVEAPTAERRGREKQLYINPSKSKIAQLACGFWCSEEASRLGVLPVQLAPGACQALLRGQY